MQHRLDGGEDVLLGDEGHLEIELVEFAGRAVGPAVLVAEAGRDLEIAVEAGDHQQLLELLRRLRQGVELAGMQPARHQEVAGAFGRARGQDRSLELGEAGRHHAAADAGDHLGPQHDVAMQLVAPKVEKAVAQPDVLARLLLAGDLQRQDVGRRLQGEGVDAQLDLAGRQLGVDGLGRPVDDPAGDGDDALRPRRLDGGQERARDVDHALRDSVMVAQIEEQQVPMVTLAMDPARQADGLSDMAAAQRAAGMRAIGMHWGRPRRTG